MIVLAVKSYNGTATEPLEATFDELGGTIGRADSNLLVLPDPDRTISRVHATVLRRDGDFVIEDRGSNPILVNGQIVGHGRQVPLAPGDQLQIGGYELTVRASGRKQAAAAAQIPDDWDPFSTGSAASAMTPAPAPPPAPAPAPATQLSSTPPRTTVLPRSTAAARPAGPATPSIDDLFGLDDKLPDTDPLPRAAPVDDVGLGADIELQLSDLASPPAPVPASAPLPAVAPIAAPTPDTRRTPVVSWDGSPRQATVVAPAGGARRSGPFAPTGSGPRPGARPPPAMAAAPAPQAPAAPADELLRAFLDGLGGNRAPPVAALTPELMRLVGGLLAESVSGAIDLLHARAVVKNEMRADVTAIRPRQNNPLKFSPTAAVALQHLLTPTVPGFLPAEAAMRDAFQDLRAHELAVMAGMRSALAGLLQRFDPKTLETHLSGKSGLSALLAGGRRAQLWEAYQSLFSQLSAEAEDDFHALFGRAFLQAYEGHLAQLKAADRPGGA